MGSVVLAVATVVFWLLTFSSFDGRGGLVVAFLPVALGLTYVAGQRLLTGSGLRLNLPSLSHLFADETLPAQFGILNIGEDWVEFEHPEAGSWSWGLAQDLQAVHGVEMIESLSGGRYRMHVCRNPYNAARVLEAAHRFRTGPKVLAGGSVDLYQCVGYDLLVQEASGELD